jgi:hypothetical protein
MYKNYTNLENFNHKLFTIFLEDGKVASPMRLLFLESGKMALEIECLHHEGSIPYDHMVSPKCRSNETQRHVTYRLKTAICYRNERHIPLRDSCP